MEDDEKKLLDLKELDDLKGEGLTSHVVLKRLIAQLNEGVDPATYFSLYYETTIYLSSLRNELIRFWDEQKEAEREMDKVFKEYENYVVITNSIKQAHDKQAKKLKGCIGCVEATCELLFASQAAFYKAYDGTFMKGKDLTKEQKEAIERQAGTVALFIREAEKAGIKDEVLEKIGADVKILNMKLADRLNKLNDIEIAERENKILGCVQEYEAVKHPGKKLGACPGKAYIKQNAIRDCDELLGKMVKDGKLIMKKEFVGRRTSGVYCIPKNEPQTTISEEEVVVLEEQKNKSSNHQQKNVKYGRPRNSKLKK